MSCTRRSPLLACLAAWIAVLSMAIPSSASARSPAFGAWNPNEPYHGSVAAADALEAATGRRVAIVNWYQSWGGGSWIAALQSQAVAAVTGSGRTPMLTWEPWTPGAGTDQPGYSLARIAGGEFDAYIAGWAVGLRALGSPVYLRPMHEMNGDWYPWSGVVNGNTPELYVQAWRRIVDVFRTSGATNVRFVWSPSNVDVPAGNQLERYYPGASYVDVLAVDGYNWGASKPEFGGWQSFSAVFANAYDRLRALGPQPIWIAEVGSAPEGGDKAAWVRDMFAQAESMDRLEAIVWFNENKERDWRADATPEIAASFAPGAAAAAPGSGAGDDGPLADASKDSRAGAPPRLRLALGRVPRAGRSATVRWRATRASAVARWLTYLDGRRVRSAARTAPQVARARIVRPGRHRWRVVGRDAGGRTIVSASRAFRVRR